MIAQLNKLWMIFHQEISKDYVEICSFELLNGPHFNIFQSLPLLKDLNMIW